MPGKARNSSSVVTQQTMNVDVHLLTGELAAAYSRGASDARAQIDALERTVQAREAAIKERDERIAALYDRLEAANELLTKSAATNASLAIVQGQKEIAIERLKASRDRDVQMYKVLQVPLERVASMLPGGTADPKLAPLRRALDKVLEDEELCARLQARVGTEDWLAVVDWAAGLGGTA
ncbi:uncharacterized protein SOCE26_040140 [Sorangium cellulosum]|uniref:Uncharacterized protein n=1 Tax=Sorangium cellulosum TaxID=56 RepID=A0A2L0ETF7_SORCE|nr:hypothetical protein [Sorangium cellulosum]AUX42581.1 uncharacterized protein SOCE26_040140 [Sorangium cellulosum]